jgi:hypothetical protein
VGIEEPSQNTSAAIRKHTSRARNLVSENFSLVVKPGAPSGPGNGPANRLWASWQIGLMQPGFKAGWNCSSTQALRMIGVFIKFKFGCGRFFFSLALEIRFGIETLQRNLSSQLTDNSGPMRNLAGLVLAVHLAQQANGVESDAALGMSGEKKLKFHDVFLSGVDDFDFDRTSHIK